MWPVSNLARKRGVTWLVPRLVAAVTFQEWMEGFLRHPCFAGLSDAKSPNQAGTPSRSLKLASKVFV